jgi:hypothetical protein
MSYMSKKKERQLIQLYSNTDDTDIARILSVPKYLVRMKAEELGLQKEDEISWSPIDVFCLSENYRAISNEELSRLLQRPKAEIEHYAYRMGMRKNDSFWSNISITSEERELLSKWNNKYNSKKHGSSRGNFVLGKILIYLFPRYTLIPEYPIGGLRVDWVIKDLQIGLEFNGVQHSEYNTFFFETKADFERAKLRDYDKSYLCEKAGIGLVTFYHDEELSMALVKAKINEII